MRDYKYKKEDLAKIYIKQEKEGPGGVTLAVVLNLL